MVAMLIRNEPWVRFGIRISPKISEKPAESRNSRLPSATLFTARISSLMPAVFSLAWSRQSAGADYSLAGAVSRE